MRRSPRRWPRRRCLERPRPGGPGVAQAASAAARASRRSPSTGDRHAGRDEIERPSTGGNAAILSSTAERRSPADPGADEHEFIATDPGDGVHQPDRFGEDRSDGAQDVVARRMPDRLVDGGGQVVDVEQWSETSPPCRPRSGPARARGSGPNVRSLARPVSGSVRAIRSEPLRALGRSSTEPGRSTATAISAASALSVVRSVVVSQVRRRRPVRSSAHRRAGRSHPG